MNKNDASIAPINTEHERIRHNNKADHSKYFNLDGKCAALRSFSYCYRDLVRIRHLLGTYRGNVGRTADAFSIIYGGRKNLDLWADLTDRVKENMAWPEVEFGRLLDFELDYQI